MPYDTFMIYFLLFPTLTLVLGILVTHSAKVIRNFLLSASSASLSLVFYFFLLDWILIGSNVKVLNLYFNHRLKIGAVSALQLSYYFLIPWFIGSLCLLMGHLPHKTPQRRRRRVTRSRNVKPVLMTINALFLANAGLLYLSFENPSWFGFRLLALNLLWILPTTNGFLYFRSKKKFHQMAALNWAGLLTGLYTMTGLLFVSERLYEYGWYSLSGLGEELFFTGAVYLIATEILILFSYFWHKRSAPKKEADHLLEEWKTPFLDIIAQEEVKSEVIKRS